MSQQEFINKLNESLEKDKYGLYIHAPNYAKVRSEIDAYGSTEAQ